MKICIELDEEMKERWDEAKDNLEDTIKWHGDTGAKHKFPLRIRRY